MSNTEKRIKEAVASVLYQKYSELYFDDPIAECFLDCLMYLSGDETFEERAIAHIGENFIDECLKEYY